ncbi:response regulator [Halopiger thermotolerans]
MTANAVSESVDILLAEDNRGDIRLIKEAFHETDIEPTFHTATSGNEALEFLRDRCDTDAYPDLLLLDLNMPRKDGFEVLEELRENEAYPPLPVLVLTSSRADDDVVKSYELAANAYLSKPRNPDEFVSLAQAIEAFWIHEAQLPPVSSQ